MATHFDSYDGEELSINEFHWHHSVIEISFLNSNSKRIPKKNFEKYP